MRGFKNKGLKIAVVGGLLLAGALAVLVLFLSKVDVAVFEPKGVLAEKERTLMVTALLLSLLVVIPVYAMTVMIAWKYRASNTKAKYSPDWDGSRAIETAWWLIPTALIGILSIIAWRSAHALDPFKPIESSKKPLTIQVVAMQWKWLFLYPEQDIASVNFVQFPVDQPLRFEITSDGPMNSFWVPKLGGQLYAMSGMSTTLHLMASEAGDYPGSSANISGEGFSGMRFTARASSDNDFAAWVNSVKESPNKLDAASFKALSTPSLNNPQAFYGLQKDDLYNEVVNKFMGPAHKPTEKSGEHEQGHRDYKEHP